MHVENIGVKGSEFLTKAATKRIYSVMYGFLAGSDAIYRLGKICFKNKES